MPQHKRSTVVENVGGEPYEYSPLTRHIVCAPAVCDGQPTFIYTRIAAYHAIELIAGGRTLEEVATAYKVPVEAVQEALDLASRALAERAG